MPDEQKGHKRPVTREGIALLIEDCERISAALSINPTPFQLEQAVNFLVATVPSALRNLEEQLEALRFSAARYHETQNEVNALAQQLASEWGWPDRESVLQRLRGDQTAARTTFTEDAYRAFLGVSPNCSSADPFEADGFTVLGRCVHGIDLDREFCPQGCRV